MVDYGKKSKTTKGKKEDFGKIHREGITSMMERQFFNDISPAYNQHLNKYHKGDYNTLKKAVNLNQSGVMRCNHERHISGVC